MAKWKLHISWVVTATNNLTATLKVNVSQLTKLTHKIQGLQGASRFPCSYEVSKYTNPLPYLSNVAPLCRRHMTSLQLNWFIIRDEVLLWARIHLSFTKNIKNGQKVAAKFKFSKAEKLKLRKSPISQQARSAQHLLFNVNVLKTNCS